MKKYIIDHGDNRSRYKKDQNQMKYLIQPESFKILSSLFLKPDCQSIPGHKQKTATASCPVFAKIRDNILLSE